MKLFQATHYLLIFSSVLHYAHAWGGLGHETVAFVASEFVSPHTKIFLQSVLGDKTPYYLANVSTWADSYRYTKAGKFSAPFHYIDAKDNPPTRCGVSYNRDCAPAGCIVGAISNYTTRLRVAGLPKSQRAMAAKFLIHFVGDIHQPLHNENLEKGGNGIKVTFGSKETNLHSIWDTDMPEKLIGGYSIIDAQQWAATLSLAIRSGPYKSMAAGWIRGLKIDDPISSALIWAKEANAYICSTVMPDGPEVLGDTNLDGDYFEAAVPVIQLQVARAGYRLAAWMNLIATGARLEEL